MEKVEGKLLASKILGQAEEIIKQNRDRSDRAPKLLIYQYKDDPASDKYVGLKIKAGVKIGLDVEHKKFYSLNEMVSDLESSATKDVDGVMVQLPIDTVENSEVLMKIPREKDADGLNPLNLGLIFNGDYTYLGATPRAVVEILDEHEVELEGKDILVIGNTPVIGLPIAGYLTNQSATVEIANSKTQDLKSKVHDADIVISATGVGGLITHEYLSEDTVFIDVGIDIKDGKLAGDLLFDTEAEEKLSLYTPVPGGVGPVTVASLIKTCVNLWLNNLNNQ